MRFILVPVLLVLLAGCCGTPGVVLPSGTPTCPAPQVDIVDVESDETAQARLAILWEMHERLRGRVDQIQGVDPSCP